MQVVEEQDERLALRQRLQQAPHSAMGAVALDLEPTARRPSRRQRGQHERELRPHVLVHAVQAARLEAAHVLVERIDEHAERQVALELGCAAREHEPAARVGSGAQLLEQRRLPDPRLADDFEHGRSVPRELGQHRLQRLELGGAPDDLLGRQSHGRVPSP